MEVIAGRFAVSIHAPTRGATDGRKVWDLLVDVSIHAPTRGATSPDFNVILKIRFNSRAHAGRDWKIGSS